MMRYRDYVAALDKTAAAKEEDKKRADRKEIFDVLFELAHEEDQQHLIPYATRDGRKRVLVIDKDGCRYSTGRPGESRKIPRERAEEIFARMTDDEIRPIMGGTIADRQLWEELCQSLDDNAVKFLDRVIKSVQGDMDKNSAREMHFKGEDGADHILTIKRAEKTDFRAGDHGIMMTLDGKSCTDSDTLQILERASQIEKAELLYGQRQLFLKQLKARATLVATRCATSIVRSALRQMEQGADQMGR